MTKEFIGKKVLVRSYDAGVYFGEHLYKLNDIKRLEEKTARERKRFLVWTVLGWLLAVLMFGVALFK